MNARSPHAQADHVRFEIACVTIFAAILRKWIATVTSPYHTSPLDLYGHDIALDLTEVIGVPEYPIRGVVELLTRHTYRHIGGLYPPFALGWNPVTQRFIWECPSLRVDVYL